jgi:hypothetical protein
MKGRVYKECATCETGCQGCAEAHRKLTNVRGWLLRWKRHAVYWPVDEILAEIESAIAGKSPPKARKVK